jgi:hypothetical protein
VNDDVEQLIEDVLSAPRAIEPSPYFARRVMTAVRREAELPPLAFPWKRFVAAVVFFAVSMSLGIAGGGAGPAAVAPHGAWLALFAAPGFCVVFAMFASAMPTRRAR